jgi:hypothetical protein
VVEHLFGCDHGRKSQIPFNEPFGGRTVRQRIDLFGLWHLSQPHHAVLRKRRFPSLLRIGPNWRGFVRAFCLCNVSRGFQAPFRRLCLCLAKSRFPTVETGVGGDSVRTLGQCDGKPSISCCLDHPAGKSVRPATPMPWGSRPSMAALTRSGARKASEIVMFTLRMLQFSRFAMLSVVIDASVVSSSSQQRPRAMAATNIARVSERIGRACRGGIPSGRRNSRRRVDGVLCQGT